MRISIAIGVAAMLVASLLVAGVAATGNGATSGPHFNLNLIGKQKTDQLPNDANNGARIFVTLNGNSRIYLTLGTTFEVIDADATDGRGEFMLPAPENIYNPTTGEYLGPGNYRVFVRVVGKPGGSGKISTCGENTDVLTGVTETLCSLDNVTLIRKKGKSTFQDVTRQLTTVYYYNTTTMTYQRVDIFNSAFQDYLWSYDNLGMKNVQLRFYPING